MEKIFGSLPQEAKIWSKGQVTLPVSLRRELGIKKNDRVAFARIGKAAILAPKKLILPKLVKQVEKEMEKRRITLKELLADLRENREKTKVK